MDKLESAATPADRRVPLFYAFDSIVKNVGDASPDGVSSSLPRSRVSPRARRKRSPFLYANRYQPLLGTRIAAAFERASASVFVSFRSGALFHSRVVSSSLSRAPTTRDDGRTPRCETRGVSPCVALSLSRRASLWPGRRRRVIGPLTSSFCALAERHKRLSILLARACVG